MQLKYSFPAFWIDILISLTVHLDPLFAQEDFYRGKTITIIQGRDPGGSGDLRVKVMMPFLQETYSGKSDGN